MMHGPEKSDRAIVAGKPANKAEQSAAESVERRAGAKGNAHQQSTHWTQSQARVSQALERIRQAIAVIHPRWEPYAGKPPVRFCAGGAMKIASLPLRRRDFLSGLACAVTASPIARAQTTSSAIRKIGVVTLGVPQSAPLFKAFITGLHELGYEPGKNIVLEFRHAEGRADRLSDLVTDVIAQNVDVI